VASPSIFANTKRREMGSDRVAASLQLVEDLSKPFVTHIGQGFGRQLSIRCRAASL
jgi:hypothetical protein